MNTAPKIKIEMITLSVRCFFLGVLSLFPVFGIPMAVLALRHHGRVRQIRDGHWNPAHRYLYWGVVCARLAVVLLALEITAAAAVYTMESR
jgi:hypothetical protein